jgi:glycine betaine catabolism A
MDQDVSKRKGETRLNELIAGHVAGHALQRDFYMDEEIYQTDLERIWRRGWLCAGHTCQIRNPGDYLTVEIDSDSIIVLRGDDGEIHGMHNVCRHRGMRLCQQQSGHVNRLVCPYHQWVYGRDGSLLSCRGMQEDLDKSLYSLRKIHVRQVEGMIFLSLAKKAPDFGPAQTLLSQLTHPQGFGRAKVAKRIDYEVRANWKLVWENNRECWHCNVNHPQYVKANFDHFNSDDTTDIVRHRLSEAVARNEAEWAQAGLAISHRAAGMTLFPDADNNIWFSANRTPLVENYVSETMDGRQVAPLMGDYTGPTVGTLRVRTLPNFWNHSSCDHGVSTLLWPAGPELTRVSVIWLVDEHAKQGTDYQLEELLPFWQLTSEQDWEICENQQRGIRSSAYAPGPYSTYKEYNVAGFIRWYLKVVSGVG